MQKEQTPIDLSAKGSEALITRCGDFLYFGEFPQSLKAAGVSVNDNLTDERGYFFGSDGYYYARMRGAAISGNETFRNGSRIVPHEVYYFKVEPLRFRILEEKNGEALIVADRILTVLPFDASKNTYRESDIRTYLNGPFLKTAFTDEERELLLKTTIDNSPKSAGQARAKGKNAPTEDWIFLLSVEEVTSPQYALLWSKSVMNAKKVDYTDYTRAKGLPLTLDGYYERVPYWLRSADYQSDNRSFLVNGYTVSQSSETVTSHAVGVLPALRIRLDPEKIAIKASEEDELIIEITKKEQEEGAFVEEGEFVYFGEYPQTLKAPEVSVDKTKRDLRGYYLGSDGAWYESVGAGANGIVPLPSGQRVVKFHEYFLKVEPIRWRILEQEGSVATLVCDSILKSSIFSYDYNNYEKSHVRKWLNRWFYEKAFAESERKWILPTVVYNDERSVAGTNPYLSENTRDKLFLLSYTEATSLYSLARADKSKGNLICMNAWPRPSDYYLLESTQVTRNIGAWWLRSPSHFRDREAYLVTSAEMEAKSAFMRVSDFGAGVVPAMRVFLKTKAPAPPPPPPKKKPEKKKEAKTRKTRKPLPRIDLKTLFSKENWKKSTVTTALILLVAILIPYFLFWMPSEFVGRYYYFGEYPQSLKESSVYVDESVMDERGYYLGSDGAYYAKAVATSYKYDTTLYFPTGKGVEIESGETYYFKVEPIRWRVLEKNKDEIFLICDMAHVDSAAFFELGFTQDEKDRMIVTKLDNSSPGELAFDPVHDFVYTYYTPESRPTTEGKLFQLSYQEVTNWRYGFSPNLNKWARSRKRKPTDYASALGCYGSLGNYHWSAGCVSWGLRTEGVNVGFDGGIKLNGSCDGYVPAVRIIRGYGK